MFSKFRKCAVTLGAAALVCGQAVHAAPAQPAPAVDPLVAVSLLGTSQSRAAVCGTGAPCTFPAATGAAAASVSPTVATAASAAATQDLPGPRESKGTFWILFLGGGMVLIAILVALLAGNDENNPVSPD